MIMLPVVTRQEKKRKEIANIETESNQMPCNQRVICKYLMKLERKEIAERFWSGDLRACQLTPKTVM